MVLIIMILRKHIDNLVQASAAADKEAVQIADKYGIDTAYGIQLHDPKCIEWLNADRPMVRKIESYLNELDLDTLLWLETVMYYGRRDDNSDIYELHQNFSNMKETKDEIVRTILEKRGAFPNYFNQAINRLEEQNIDVDTL